jgi:FtsP/CotA-like multicopper oxidase with cupredoxin domain
VLADATTEAFLVPIKQVDCLSDPPAGAIVVPFGPTMAKLGTLDAAGNPIPLNWDDNTGASTPKTVTLQSGVTMTVTVTENPTLNATEEFQIHNFTEDAHPIHLHMVRFNVVGREPLGGGTSVSGSNDPQATESGYKDTVIAYPGEITNVKAKFDIEGLFVWHCHIVEHEDNEMMRPYVVSP